jgi:hypothetical protein
MSFVISAPSFLQSFTSRGVFSAETAFQKPRVSNSASGFTSQGLSKRIPMNAHISQEKNVKGVKAKHSIDNDESLFTLEPSKKLKVSCEKGFFSAERLTAKRPNQPHSSVVKLTVAEVFDEPVKLCKSGKINFFDDDDQNDDSSLSFISSSFSSLDHIEEEHVDVKRKGSDFELDHHFKLSSNERVTEPLVVRDNVLNSFKNKECINPDDIFIPAHMIDYSRLLPLTHYHTLQSSASLLQNLQAFRNIDLINQFGIGMPPQLFAYNQQQSFYPQYPVQMIHEELLRLEQNKMNVQGRFENVKNEEGYDSDSQATKSTCIEGMDILNVGKYPKTSSSPFSNLSEVDEMEKNKPEIKKAKNNKKEVGKPKKEANKSSQPNKKKRGENLKLDINPQQLKVERRLNRLQLLRYQQGEVEEEAPLFPVEEKKNVVESEDLLDLEQLLQCQADIPPFALEEQPVRRRRNITLRWNPEVVSTENVDDYIQRLSEVIQTPVTDQEGALKLLKSHHMNVNRVMEVVQEDIAFYKELFRMKVKRCRRR